MASKIIDIHPHIISKDTKRYPITPLGGKQSVWSAERPIDFENLIASMNESGVDKAAIVHSSTTYGYDNTYMVDSIATQPKRFTGVGAVDFAAPDASEKIRYWHGRGVTGLRIFSAGSTMEKQADTLDDPKTFAAWETCEALRIPVVTQLRREGLYMLYTLIRGFPNVKIIVDHLMHVPRGDEAPYSRSAFLFEVAKYPNVYFKLSTNNVRHSRDGANTPEKFFPKLVQEIPASRIAWGSNYPASKGRLKEMVDEAKAALSCLKQSDQEWIFAKTAQSLYPALAD
ncbi:MAG TPA: amidohydrolase family protein [Burkholderiales bacterium]|nr:amidohydrolase family protein [Burkholderiales bacterium]